ncbi:MAG: TetR/AcrR family transcriptional regulator [Planctomycetaceae bacterium]|nr:TetR/AcrR family transcriptional regulator [Planctomycetaceae bacterium]
MFNPEVDGREKTPTRTKIVQCAASLFAAQGFSETSIRELAAAVGLQGSALYHHFPSKNAILEYILHDYRARNFGQVDKASIQARLRERPTVDGILSCMSLTFPEGTQEYYVKVLCVVLQEQHRNPVIGEFAQSIIHNSERKTRVIFEVLKEMNLFHRDALPDYWMKVISSLLYTFASRFLMGIGDNSPDYVGKSMAEMLRSTLELMMQCCAVTNA